MLRRSLQAPDPASGGERRGSRVNGQVCAPSPIFGLEDAALVCILNSMVQYEETLDRTFWALSDPTRRHILERLGRGPATVSELAEPFGMSLTGLKKHVRVLEQADLVSTEKVGRARVCRLGTGRLDEATGWIEAHRRRWERRLDRLEGYIEKGRGERG